MQPLAAFDTVISMGVLYPPINPTQSSHAAEKPISKDLEELLLKSLEVIDG